MLKPSFQSTVKQDINAHATNADKVKEMLARKAAQEETELVGLATSHRILTILCGLMTILVGISLPFWWILIKIIPGFLIGALGFYCILATGQALMAMRILQSLKKPTWLIALNIFGILIPVFNIIFLQILESTCNLVFHSHGFPIGWLGVSPDSVRRYRKTKGMSREKARMAITNQK